MKKIKWRLLNATNQHETIDNLGICYYIMTTVQTIISQILTLHLPNIYEKKLQFKIITTLIIRR